VIPQGDGERLQAQDRELFLKAVRPELDFLEFEVRPGYKGPGPHFHKRHADSFYVLEGELEFTLAGETVRVSAGTFVAVPPNVVHAFTNAGPGGARFLNLHAPDSGFVDYLRARAGGDDVDPERFDIWDVDE
jgi:quercetin dioxygenase-like cupin family protein